jgi:hypothetical protein
MADPRCLKSIVEERRCTGGSFDDLAVAKAAWRGVEDLEPNGFLRVSVCPFWRRFSQKISEKLRSLSHCSQPCGLDGARVLANWEPCGTCQDGYVAASKGDILLVGSLEGA